MSNKKKILVIDYDSNSLLITGDILKHAGYRVYGALSVEEALIALREERYFMVLADLLLLLTHNYKLLNKLRTDYGSGEKYLMVMSVIHGCSVFLKDLNVEVAKYLQKPVKPDDLIDKLRLLDKQDK
jgi:CheY-like chemotaxis protein